MPADSPSRHLAPHLAAPRLPRSLRVSEALRITSRALTAGAAGHAPRACRRESRAAVWGRVGRCNAIGSAVDVLEIGGGTFSSPAARAWRELAAPPPTLGSCLCPDHGCPHASSKSTSAGVQDTGTHGGSAAAHERDGQAEECQAVGSVERRASSRGGNDAWDQNTSAGPPLPAQDLPAQHLGALPLAYVLHQPLHRRLHALACPRRDGLAASSGGSKATRAWGHARLSACAPGHQGMRGSLLAATECSSSPCMLAPCPRSHATQPAPGR